VPLGVKALLVVLPSNVTDERAILLLSLLSVITNLSPLAIVISLVYKVPDVEILP